MSEKAERDTGHDRHDVNESPEASEEIPINDTGLDMGDLYDELQALEEAVDDPEERRRVREAMRTAMRVEPSVFGRVVRGFGREDLAEAFLGAIIFGIPMFVEGGTQEIGVFVSTHPLYLLVTLVFGIGTVIGILYVADIQDVRVTNPLLGVIPRRLVGVLGVSFVTALIVMTVWGRVNWTQPWLAFSTVSVAFVPMAIGAALGDIVPGS